MKTKMMLIDGHYILHRSLHIPELAVMMTSEGVPSGGVFGFLSSLRKSLEEYSSVNRVVVVWDTGRSPRRERILPSYKGNRNPKNSEEEEEMKLYSNYFSSQASLLKENLINLGVRQAALPEREGDDIISLICQVYPNVDKVIVSDDKDMIQLVDEHTRVYRPVKEEEVNVGNFLEKTGAIDRERFLVAKAILGDESDNIPGLNRVGKKTVEELLEIVNEEEVEEEWDSAAAVPLFIEACEKIPRTKKGQMKARFKGVYCGGVDIIRNLRMVDLSLEKFNEAEEEAIKFYVEGGQVAFIRENVIGFFVRMEFKSIMPYFSIFDRLFGQLR